MLKDPGNRFRALLRANPYLSSTKVDTPWQDFPDLEDVNRPAFERICFVLEGFKRFSPGRPAPSEGLAVFGEAGTGKSHLLMRVTKRLAGSNYVLFVPRPNNEEAVYLHTWTNIVQSLAEVVPARSKDRSQLDDMLAHVFSAVLLPGFEAGPEEQRRWAKKLRDDPLNLFTMLGTGPQRSDNMRKIRNRTLKYLSENHPQADQTISHALITYALTAEEDRRRRLLTWLGGQGGLDAKEEENLGLPSQWVEVGDDGEANHRNYLQQREDRAFAAIKTLGILSTYYQPLILAFDQLEGLRQREALTRRWGESVREIINYAPNYLILVCVFPSLWDQWVEKGWVETSTVQRIAKRRVTLEPFSELHAIKFLESRTQGLARELGLPSPIYPFEHSDVAEICARASTPREFLEAALLDRFEAWLFEDDPSPAPAPPRASASPRPSQAAPAPTPRAEPPRPPAVTPASVLAKELPRLEAMHAEMLARRPLSEEDLFGRVKTIVEALLEHHVLGFDVAEYGKRVMPFNVVVLPPDDHGLCLSVLNSTGKALQARLSNLHEVSLGGHAFGSAIIVRDKRCGPPSPGTVAASALRQLQRAGNIYLEADQKELARLNAVYKVIVDIEQQDLRAGNHLITLADLVHYFRSSGYLRQSQFFLKAGQLSAVFRGLLGGESQNDIPPQPPPHSGQGRPSPPDDRGRDPPTGPCETGRDQPPPPPPDAKTGRSDKGPGERVACAVFAPPQVARGQEVFVQAFAFQIGRADEAAALAKEFDEGAARRGFTNLAVPIYRGQTLEFGLSVSGAAVNSPLRPLAWQGITEAVQFLVTVPIDHPTGNLFGELVVSVEGVPVGRIGFKLTVIANRPDHSAGTVSVGESATRFRKAFASYASADRPEVMRRVQVLRPPLCNVEVSLDVLSLEPGEPWGRRIFELIDECDIFLLFWSTNARGSDWVRREWEHALRRKGPNGELPPTILPIPIEGPPHPAPPPELAHLHFGDRLLPFATQGRA